MDTKALRQKILDLAIRGKLVPQNPDDEPASVLLEKIRLEKQKMVKEGKLKPKDVKNDTIIYRGDDNLHYEKYQDGTVKCIEDEIPFDVPEGWEWCRLQSMCSTLTDGTHKTPTYSNDGYIFLSSKNVTSGKIDWDNVMYIPEYLHQELYTRIAPQYNDILLAKNGTTGVAALVDKDECFDIYVSLALIRIVNNIIVSEYVLNVIGSTYLQDYFKSSLKGIGVPNLHLEHIRKSLIPVPPYNEQIKLIKYCKRMLQKTVFIQNDKEELQNLIKIAKSKILDLAIKGKLVTQNTDDEPATVLLERIRNEKEELIKVGKIKRDKKDSVIFRGDDNSYYEKYTDGSKKCISEEIPFELPSSWEWCRLSDIVDLYSGQDLTPDKYNNNMIGIPYITGASNLDNGKVIVNRWTDTPTTHAIPGDLLLTCKGSGVGKMAFNNIEDCHIARQIMALRSKKLINKDYLKIVLDAFIKDITKQANGIIPGVRREVILSVIFPLPPSEEQKRIVSTLEKIFENFETLKISLI